MAAPLSLLLLLGLTMMLPLPTKSGSSLFFPNTAHPPYTMAEFAVLTVCAHQAHHFLGNPSEAGLFVRSYENSPSGAGDLWNQMHERKSFMRLGQESLAIPKPFERVQPRLMSPFEASVVGPSETEAFDYDFTGQSSNAYQICFLFPAAHPASICPHRFAPKQGPSDPDALHTLGTEPKPIPKVHSCSEKSLKAPPKNQPHSPPPPRRRSEKSQKAPPKNQPRSPPPPRRWK